MKRAYFNYGYYIIRIQEITEDSPFKVYGTVEGVDVFPNVFFNGPKKGCGLRSLNEIILHGEGDVIEVNHRIEPFYDNIDYDESLCNAREFATNEIKAQLNANLEYIVINQNKVSRELALEAIELINTVEPVTK